MLLDMPPTREDSDKFLEDSEILAVGALPGHEAQEEEYINFLDELDGARTEFQEKIIDNMGESIEIQSSYPALEAGLQLVLKDNSGITRGAVQLIRKEEFAGNQQYKFVYWQPPKSKTPTVEFKDEMVHAGSISRYNFSDSFEANIVNSPILRKYASNTGN
jgi:hypothetical protein